jgi:hypothetical protein
MTRTTNLTAKGFQNVARSLASKSDVSVEFGGAECSTDGRTMHLPAIHGHENQDVILGKLVHECGHIRATNLSIDPAGFTNLFEDHRVERHMRGVLGGGEELLTKAWKHIASEWNVTDVEDSDPFQSVSDYLIQKGQEVTMDRKSVTLPYADVMNAAKENVEKHWGKITHVLDAYLVRSQFTRSTADCALMSREVLNLLKNLDENEQPENPPENGDDGNNLEEEQQNQGGQGDQNQQSSSGGGQDLGIDGETLQKSKDFLEQAINQGVQSPDFSDQLDKMVQQIIDESVDEHGLAPVLQGVGCRNEDLYLVENERVLHQAELVGSGVNKALKQLLETEARKRPQARRRGNKVLSRNVSRVAVGDSRVFAKTPYKPGIDTAVTIAVDMSSSMKGHRAESALASSLGLAKALHTTKGTSSRMTIFPGVSSKVQQVVNRGTMPDYSLSGIVASGGTPLTEAVEDAVLELQPLSNKKKVAFVITDGQVSRPETDHAVSLAKDNGVALHWISICNEHFPAEENVVHVSDADELPEALLAQAKGVF